MSRAIHEVRNELNRPFWERAGVGRFALPVCRYCGDFHFPTVVILSTPSLRPAAWLIRRLVLLDEGLPLISNLVGDVAGAAHSARLGAVFERATDEIDLPKLRLSSHDNSP